LEGDSLQAGVLGHFEQESGYASITVEPPKIVPDAMVTPRELIFLMDTSGSQEGQPIEASKKFMNVALAALRPEDHFRIIQFENTVTKFSSDAMSASAKNIKAGQSFVRRMVAGGGTDIDAGIEAAFGPQKIPGTLRIVVFLSDGLVGNEGQVIKRIRKDIGDARIYSFGVGASVNRYLMDGVATQGRGYARYIDPTDDASEVAIKFAADLKTPVLTDVSVDWGNLQVVDATPARLPDLFEGGSVRVLARYKTGGKHTITIKGKVNGVSAALPMEIDLPNVPSEKASNALPLIWARNRIAEKTLDYNTGMGNIERLKDEVIELGLKHSLQSQFTSFVAVSKVVYNDAPETAQNKAVALPKVAATSAAAYPSAISGSSTPEPETWLGILLALALGLMRYWWRFWATLVRRLNLKGGGYHASI
jgi:Ca-activated chloride channel family protein